MLLPYERLIHTPVMSLQTGAELARISRVLVDPRNLTITAYELEGPVLDEHPSFIRPIDVRELSNLGLIVDSSDEFVGLNDVIKIREVYDFAFDLINLEVIDDKKHRLGKVRSYNLDSESFAVQQLVVKRPLLHSLNEGELTIGRSQILEINNTRVLVKSTFEKEPLKESIREYTNPFRSSTPQPEATETTQS